MTATLAGHLLVECLLAQGVTHAFGVPGESYLAVLDGATVADLIAPANRKPEVQAVSLPVSAPGRSERPVGQGAAATQPAPVF